MTLAVCMVKQFDEDTATGLVEWLTNMDAGLQEKIEAITQRNLVT